MPNLFDDAISDGELKQILASLREWSEAYYNGSPVVADAIYDSFEDKARSAAKDRPEGDPLRVEVEEFLAGVGAAVPTVPSDSAWDKAKHRSPMGSLNKAQHQTGLADEHAEFDAWFAECRAEIRSMSGMAPLDLFISEKLDGISIALYYVDGTLVQAVTRGDGEVGEDITRNVLKMKGVRKEIKGLTGNVRGEVTLRHSDWKAHFPSYSNPRNAASGIAKRLDGVGCEHLTILHYRLLRDGKADLDKSVQFQAFEKLGMPTPNYVVLHNSGMGHDPLLADAHKVYERYVESARAALDYDIDGLVIEFNAADVQDALGEKNNRPKGAVAYKFPHEKKPTRLQGIRWQVGNTGRVTPVAIFDTVRLAGADVSQASLHNVQRVEKLKLFEGCNILVSRRNDVIPMVEGNIDEDIYI